MKIKLTGAGFNDYTGQMGVLYFENGVSVGDVLPIDAHRIACSIGAEWEDGSPANVGDMYNANINLSVDQLDEQAKAVFVGNAQQAVDQAQVNAEKQFVAEGTEVPTPTVVKPSDRYTREELEDYVDKNGLKGLRTLAAQYGVKGTSINVLINEILKVAGA